MTEEVLTSRTKLTLIPVDNQLWIVDAPFRILGAQCGTRMTVMGYDTDKLVIHSPIPYREELARSLDDLGTITHLVAPSLHHNLYMDEWQKQYPDAMVLAPRKTKRINSDMSLQEFITSAYAEVWKDQIKLWKIKGIPMISEFAFLHYASKTLVLTDLVFNIQKPCDWWTKSLFKLYGAWQKFGPTVLIKSLIRDKAVFCNTLKSILQEDFDRIVMGHGEVLEHDAKAKLKQAFSFIV